jgi:hypothetical protein
MLMLMTTRSRLRIALAAAAIVVFAATPAFAAGPPPPKSEDAAIEQAEKARFDEGLKLYGKKRYEEARAAFLQAAAFKRRPAARLMLAQSSLKAGRWLEALKQFDAYVV